MKIKNVNYCIFQFSKKKRKMKKRAIKKKLPDTFHSTNMSFKCAAKSAFLHHRLFLSLSLHFIASLSFIHHYFHHLNSLKFRHRSYHSFCSSFKKNCNKKKKGKTFEKKFFNSFNKSFLNFFPFFSFNRKILPYFFYLLTLFFSLLNIIYLYLHFGFISCQWVVQSILKFIRSFLKQIAVLQTKKTKAVTFS